MPRLLLNVPVVRQRLVYPIRGRFSVFTENIIFINLTLSDPLFGSSLTLSDPGAPAKAGPTHAGSSVPRAVFP
jgi:hypothetical protein